MRLQRIAFTHPIIDPGAVRPTGGKQTFGADEYELELDVATGLVSVTHLASKRTVQVNVPASWEAFPAPVAVEPAPEMSQVAPIPRRRK